MSNQALIQMQQQLQSASYEEQVSMLSFIADLLKKKIQPQKKLQPKHKLGGLEKGFWIADDFDETPDCFKDYI